MRTPVVDVYQPGFLPPRQKAIVLLAVGVARLLAALPPRRIEAALTWLCRGAAPATYEQAQAARKAVVTVSVFCAGEGCLPRSIATALLCRTHGVWPTWYVGTRRYEPFGAHAWVEVDDNPVDEPFRPGYYVPLITVPPHDKARDRRSAPRRPG